MRILSSTASKTVMSVTAPRPAADPSACGPRLTSEPISSTSTNQQRVLPVPTAAWRLQTDPVSNPSPTSVLQFILTEQNGASCSTDLAELLNSIQASIKAISATLRFGSGDKHSAHVKAARIFTNFIQSSRPACMLLTPDHQIPFYSENDKRGKYAVCFQPLEESCGETYLFAGSVFGVHKVYDGHGSSKGTPRSPLLPGRRLVAAGYALYGTTTTLVLSLGRTSNIFTLDQAIGEFVLCPTALSVPPRGHRYNIDESQTYEWDPAIVEFIESKKDPKQGKPYCSQHLGCIVADVHATLTKGGICMSARTRSRPNGNFSILTCLAPLAYVACAAGGLASNGEVALLDLCPESVTQTTAAFIGSRDDVRDLLSCLRRRRRTSTINGYAARTISLSSYKTQCQIKQESADNSSTSSSQNRVRQDDDLATTGKSITICDSVKPKCTSSPLLTPILPNTFAPVAPYTTMKNDRVRLAWPALGNLLRNQTQQPCRNVQDITKG